MARTKKDAVVENETTEQDAVHKTASRPRKKKIVEPELIAKGSTDIPAEQKVLTAYECDVLEFDTVTPAGLMLYKSSDYENGSTGYELCTRHLRHLIRKTELSVFKIGVLLNAVDRFHGENVHDKYNWSYESNYYEFNKERLDPDNKLYRERSYFKDIYDYAAYYLGLSKGTVSNYMNLALRFTDNKISIIDGEVHLLDDYSLYTAGQLIQLLPYDDDIVKRAINDKIIMPTMSCRMIAKTMKNTFKISSNQDALVDTKADVHTSDVDESIIDELNQVEAAQQGENLQAAVNDDMSRIKISSLDALPDFSYFKSVFDMYVNSGYEIELIAVRK